MKEKKGTMKGRVLKRDFHNNLSLLDLASHYRLNKHPQTG